MTATTGSTLAVLILPKMILTRMLVSNGNVQFAIIWISQSIKFVIVINFNKFLQVQFWVLSSTN